MVVRRVLGTFVATVIVATGVVSWQSGAEADGGAVAHHRKSETLGPVGYRKLRIGMTRAQVRRTHQARISGRDGVCSTIRLRAHRSGRNQVSGFVSDRFGLVAIFAQGPMHTPAGIHVGSTRKQVRAAYPHLRNAVDGSYATVRGHRRLAYEFLFQGAGPKAKVYEMALMRKRQDCFN